MATEDNSDIGGLKTRRRSESSEFVAEKGNSRELEAKKKKNKDE